MFYELLFNSFLNAAICLVINIKSFCFKFNSFLFLKQSLAYHHEPIIFHNETNSHVSPFKEKEIFNICPIMNYDTRSAYIDFIENINGIDTKISIFETSTNIFIYVDQSQTRMHLYNDYLKSMLQSSCKGMKHKQFNVLCNLSDQSSLDHVANLISKILNE